MGGEIDEMNVSQTGTRQQRHVHVCLDRCNSDEGTSTSTQYGKMKCRPCLLVRAIRNGKSFCMWKAFVTYKIRISENAEFRVESFKNKIFERKVKQCRFCTYSNVFENAVLKAENGFLKTVTFSNPQPADPRFFFGTSKLLSPTVSDVQRSGRVSVRRTIERLRYSL